MLKLLAKVVAVAGVVTIMRGFLRDQQRKARDRERKLSPEHSRRRYYEHWEDPDDLLAKDAQALEIYLPEKHVGWQSEPVLEASGAMMEALGYELQPDEDVVGIGGTTR